MKQIIEVVKNRILLCDGAMGTMLQRAGVEVDVCPEERVLSRPELVREIHRQYIQAGAEIVETNTFGANGVKLALYELEHELERINRSAVALARGAARGKAYVAGSVGPLGVQLAPVGTYCFIDAVSHFRRQIKALASAGIDALFLETFSDIREIRAALIAAREVSRVPVVALMVFEGGERTLTGTPPDVAAVTLSAGGAAMVGANCGAGPEELLAVLDAVRNVSSSYPALLPNAGLPVLDEGETRFTKTPADMAEFAVKAAEAGARVIGGCCGTTPDHIRAMAVALKKRKPRACTVPARLRLCSRSKIVELVPERAPLVIGERINLSVRKGMAGAFIEGDVSLLRQAAFDQVKEGAVLLDINTAARKRGGADSDHAEKALMKRAVNVAQRCVKSPLVIDSNDPRVIEAGLIECEGRALINSVTAERETMGRVLSLARRYGAAIVALPLSGKGIPPTAAARVKLAGEICQAALRTGLAPEDILVDPLVLSASADREQVRVTLETLRLLKERGYQTIMGLSNVSFGLPERAVLNAVFLSMAMREGIDAVILNPAEEEVMRSLRAGRVLMNLDRGARDYIRHAVAATPKDDSGSAATTDARGVVNSLREAVITGDREGIGDLVEEALRKGIPPLEINLSILSPALEEVGRRFERKELFLPQMILSAETVREAFLVLKREMAGEEMPVLGRVIMATVEGDIHDIGKNICVTVLENSGYEVIDLGRSVPAETIADRAAETGVDIIGLSALMTTTMPRMENVIAELKKRGLNQKVMVGGAVVTESYAREIGADGYAKDAGGIVGLVKRIISK